MEKFTLYLGLNDKNTKKQEINTIEAYKIVNNVVNNYCDGATIYECQGIYKHDNGTIVFEKTLKIELMFVDRLTVVSLVKDLKEIFNQESIVLQKEIVESELI